MPVEQKSQAKYLGISRSDILYSVMKKPKAKKPKKYTEEEQKIIDEAAQQLAEILMEVIIEKQNVAGKK